MAAQLLESPFVAPPTIGGATWTSFAPGAPAPTASDITINGAPGVRLIIAGQSANSVKGLVKTKPGTNWTVSARIRRHMPMGTSLALGLLMRESATGKLLIFGWTGVGVGKIRFSSYTAVAASITSAGGASGQYCPWDGWLRIVRSQADFAAGGYRYYISEDGDSWSYIGSETLTANFSVEANQIGIGLNPVYNVGINLALDLFSYQTSTP